MTTPLDTCLKFHYTVQFSGMLSKSRGQVLRLATVLHMLFSIDNPEEAVKEEVSEGALKAAVNFVKLACQQTSYIAGKGKLEDELEKFKTGEYSYLVCVESHTHS